MDILELIKSRRSIREFTAEPVAEADINRILEAGRWAPSANNSQPCKFIVVRRQEARQRLADVMPTGYFLPAAQVAVAVVVDPEASKRCIEDGAAATQNMLLEAHSLGLGACWIGCYGTEKEVGGKEVLEIPEEERLQCVIAIGRPAESPEAKERKPLEEMTFKEKYGRR